MELQGTLSRDSLEEDSKDSGKTLWILIKDFCDYTSAHGFGRIKASKNWFLTIFWSMLFVGTGTIMTIQLHSLYNKYNKSRPLTTLIEVETSTRLPFPTLWKLVEEKILECFGYTTAHGYGRVADAPAGSWPRRCFWLLACAAAFGIFVYQLHVLTHQYLSKPLKTRTRIIHEQNIQFPQVTVCNLNKVRRSKMPGDILRTYPQILGPITNTTDELSKLQGHELKRRIHEILAEYPDDVLRDAGHQLEDLILECKYHKMECLHGMRDYWTWFWHPKYGNCFTFNRGSDAQNKPITVLLSSLPGHAAGLKLELNIEQYEYPSEGLTDEAGVRVFIGNQHLMPFLYELGISAPPGDSTEIMLRKIVLGRLDPFGNKSCEEKSTVDNDSIFSRYNASYSEMLNALTKYLMIMLLLYAQGIVDKRQMTVSAARWPSEHYKLKVYYGELNYEAIDEELAYPVFRTDFRGIKVKH
ncbi:Acid-sensing ion channel 4 [Acropora cervicornis]|uniref:Acid-sensing ion channel 4 n=1 Tax=Acropora cervicornis TaxID=6130 RepID=A0AAD9QK90_ACRCE|nr:Acid-sensing ion channel 4 [Acropora cervicornis]